MSRNRRQRGEGQFGCLVGLVLLLLAGLVAYRMIPVKVKAADLRETVIDEARSAGHHKDPAIIGNIVSKAKMLDLPVTPEDVRIKRSNQYIYVDVEYTVPVEFPGYTYQWHFHHKAENPIF